MKHKLIVYTVIIAGLLGFLADSVMAGIPIRLSFRDTTIASGATIKYPLYVDSSLSGYTITAYQLEFTYNSSLFQFDNASSIGTMSASWGAPTAFEVSPGRIRIAAAGVDTLVGKGILVNLQFHSYLFTGPYNQAGSFTFQSSVLNQGFPTADYHNGYVTLTPGPSIVVSPNTALLTKGDLVQFTASGGTAPYTWSSTSTPVGTIDVLGKLTGLSAGFTRIVATDANSYVDTSDLVEVRAFKLSFRDTSRYQGQSMNIPVYWYRSDRPEHYGWPIHCHVQRCFVVCGFGDYSGNVIEWVWNADIFCWQWNAVDFIRRDDSAHRLRNSSVYQNESKDNDIRGNIDRNSEFSF